MSSGHQLFSGKQKREQLKEKRERARQQKLQDASGDTWTVEGLVEDGSDDSEWEYDILPDGTKKLKQKKLKFAQKTLTPGSVVICSSIGEPTSLKDVTTLGEDKKGIRSQFTVARKEEMAARKKLTFLPLTWRVDAPAPLQDAKRCAEPKRGGIPVERWWVHPHADLESSPAKPSARISNWQVKCVGLPRRGKMSGNHDEEERDLEGYLAAKASEATAAKEAKAKAKAKQPQGRKLKKGWTPPDPNKPVENVLVNHSAQDKADDAEFQRWLQWTAAIAPPSATGSSALNQFERNLQVWQQLWRTVEKSDVVLIVCDARFPNLHCPVSLLDFVCRQNKKKAVVVLNKSDWIPAEELAAWKQHFRSMAQSLSLEGEEDEDALTIPVISVKCLTGSAGSVEQRKPDQNQDKAKAGDDGRRVKKKSTKRKYDYRNQDTDSDDAMDPFKMASDAVVGTHASFKGQAKLQSEHKKDHKQGKQESSNAKEIAAQLNGILQLCKDLVLQSKKKKANKKQQHADPCAADGDLKAEPVNIGLIGQPNVGKSTLLNCLLGSKKVSVSSTAGHTKILQTIPLLEDDIVLIDCPGLCLPFYDLPPSLDTLLGTHQVAQARDPVLAVGYLGLHVRIEDIYKLKRHKDDQDQEWTAFDLCEQYAIKKSMRNRGVADNHRSAQSLVSEAYDGRIKDFYFQAPTCAAEEEGDKKKKNKKEGEVATAGGQEQGDKKQGKVHYSHGISLIELPAELPPLVAASVVAPAAAPTVTETPAEDAVFVPIPGHEKFVSKKIIKENPFGKLPPSGSTLQVHYTGRLESNGKMFDNSFDTGDRFRFQLGEDQVIKGWDVGMATMRTGEKAILKIHPIYGYGDRGAGDDIPPHAWLMFEVDLYAFN